MTTAAGRKTACRDRPATGGRDSPRADRRAAAADSRAGCRLPPARLSRDVPNCRARRSRCRAGPGRGPARGPPLAAHGCPAAGRGRPRSPARDWLRRSPSATTATAGTTACTPRSRFVPAAGRPPRRSRPWTRPAEAAAAVPSPSRPLVASRARRAAGCRTRATPRGAPVRGSAAPWRPRWRPAAEGRIPVRESPVPGSTTCSSRPPALRSHRPRAPAAPGPRRATDMPSSPPAA